MTALAELDADRAATREAIEAASARRHELLLTPGTDRELLALDRDLDKLHLQLERLDTVEPMLLAAAAVAHQDVRERQLAALITPYREVIKAFAEAMTCAHNLRRTLIDLRHAAQTSGFEHQLAHFEVPTQQFPLARESIARFEARALASLRAATVAPPPEPKYAIVMTKRIDGDLLNVGEVAGFSLDEAWRRIEAGAGEWTPGTRIPPRPAVNEGNRP